LGIVRESVEVHERYVLDACSELFPLLTPSHSKFVIPFPKYYLDLMNPQLILRNDAFQRSLMDLIAHGRSLELEDDTASDLSHSSCIVFHGARI